MKLKLVILLVCLMVSGSFAGTTGTWNDVDGLWSDTTCWSSGAVPPATSATADEIKLQRAGRTTTVNDTASIDYYQRLTLGAGTDYASGHKIVIEEADPEYPTSFGMGEFRVGAFGSATNRVGICEMTGGTLTVNDIFLSRNKNQTAGISAEGYMTISGGTVAVHTTANGISGTPVGRLMVGAYAETSGMGGKGVLEIQGSAATITMKRLYVGGNVRTETPGTGSIGILKYVLDAGGVSKITVNDTTLDAATSSDSTTQLIVQAASDPGLNVILLVENLAATAVVRRFDTIANGIVVTQAVEGASIRIGGVIYLLTYLYDAATNTLGTGNDIALVIPEPATLALLGLGLVALRRNRK